MKLWLHIALIISVLTTVAETHAREQRAVTFRTKTMGTWASLTLVTADSAALAGLAYRALSVLHGVDSLMSNWTDNSEVARINREAAPYEIEVHPEVAQVLSYAQRVNRESGGAFDITVEPLVRLWGFLGGEKRVPAQREIDTALERTGHDKLRFDPDSGLLHFMRDGVKIDLGGIAKGYGVDKVATILRNANATHALIDLSGNMVALGKSADRDNWTVGIRDPAGQRDYVARLQLADESVATSGDYEQFVSADGKRYGHILDPRTGWPASGLNSVTIVSRYAMTADAWATALFVLGADEARRIALAHDDIAVVLIEPADDGTHIIWVESPLRHKFDLEPGLGTTHKVRFF